MILPVSCALRSGVIQRVILGVVRWRPRAPRGLVSLLAFAAAEYSTVRLGHTPRVRPTADGHLGGFRGVAPIDGVAARVRAHASGGHTHRRGCGWQSLCAPATGGMAELPSAVAVSGPLSGRELPLPHPHQTPVVSLLNGGPLADVRWCLRWLQRVRHLSVPVAAGCPLV